MLPLSVLSETSGKIVAQFMLSFLYTDLSQFSINFVLMLFCTV